MGHPGLILLLAVTAASEASQSMQDTFERHTRQIVGATHPELILLSEKLSRLFRLVPMTGLPADFQFSPADSVQLAWFAHDRCKDRYGDNPGYRSVIDDAQSAAEAGAALEAMLARQEEELQDRWDNLLLELSPATGQSLTRHLEEVVTPEIVATRMDMAAIWREVPELYEQALRAAQQPAPSPEAQPVLAAAGTPAPVNVASSGGAMLMGIGGPMADECLQHFAGWLEPALLGTLADRYQLDDSAERVEAYIQGVMPEALDFEKQQAALDIQRNGLEAHQAVLDGRDPEEVFHAFGLDAYYESLAQWQQATRMFDQDRLTRARAALDAETPEKRWSDVVNSSWWRQAALEEQYVASLFPESCASPPTQHSSGHRSPVVAGCLAPAREAYLSFVQEQVADGPGAWQDHLRFLRD